MTTFECTPLAGGQPRRRSEEQPAPDPTNQEIDETMIDDEDADEFDDEDPYDDD